MLDKSPKIITGIMAFLIYFILLGLVIYYFNTKSIDKTKHYVKKNEHRIQVSLARVKSTKKIKPKSKTSLNPKSKQIPKSTSTKKIKTPKISKPIVKKKLKKKIIKEKIVKKTINKKTPKINKAPTKLLKRKETKIKHKVSKKIKTSDLFTKVKTKNNVKQKKKEKLIQKRTSKASEHIRELLKKQTIKDKGIENAYFSKVQALLQTWPAQSEFAGQKAIVRISVKPTGKFDFKVQTGSKNIQFNKELIAFLKQLQRLGLGRHKAGRSYEFNVEFIAKG